MVCTLLTGHRCQETTRNAGIDQKWRVNHRTTGLRAVLWLNTGAHGKLVNPVLQDRGVYGGGSHRFP